MYRRAYEPERVVYQCDECGGTGMKVFCDDDENPVCNQCDGEGVVDECA